MDPLVVLCLGGAFLAWSNGANDTFKGVATLYGSGTASYRTALAWAIATTAAGAVVATLLAGGVLRAFSAKGLVPDAVTASPDFVIAVVLAAATTVLIATRLGLPISTTHAIVGGLSGAGLVCARGDVRFDLLGTQFFLPLLASPVIALALGALFWIAGRSARDRLGLRADSCACVEAPAVEVFASGVAPPLQVSACNADEPPTNGAARFGIRADGALDVAHCLSAGATSFARGLNDAPKIAGLLLLAGAGRLDATTILVGIAIAMSLGGWIGARRVAQTVSEDITRMGPGQGFAANAATALLVLTASGSGLPVSTTHVSCGALFGIGAVERSVDGRIVRKILLAWVFTLPTAAAIAAVAASLLAR